MASDGDGGGGGSRLCCDRDWVMGDGQLAKGDDDDGGGGGSDSGRLYVQRV